MLVREATEAAQYALLENRNRGKHVRLPAEARTRGSVNCSGRLFPLPSKLLPCSISLGTAILPGSPRGVPICLDRVAHDTVSGKEHDILFCLPPHRQTYI